MGWINDDIINAAQKLLAQQFPYISGLQNVAIGLTMSFSIQTGEFLQIIDTTHHHWITISTIGVQNPSEVRVYDSVYSSLPRMAQAQIACILFTQQCTINVKFMDVQRQVYNKPLLAVAIIIIIINFLIQYRVEAATVVYMQLHLVQQLPLQMIQLTAYLIRL